jgi:hypothetical protein
MKTLQRRIVSIVVMCVFGYLSIGNALAQDARHNYRTNIEMNNGIILSAISVFEDLTESAISADKEGIERALQAYDAQASKTEGMLPATKRYEFRALVADIRKADKQGAHEEIAIESSEAYRTLIEALNRSIVKVPTEVSLLHYAGFKFQALLHAKPCDWHALQKAGEKAQKNWAAIKPRVTDGDLRDAVDVTIGGMKRACASKNADMALFAAQEDLALVGLLEAYFEK